jgi:hypothetical protein
MKAELLMEEILFDCKRLGKSYLMSPFSEENL